MKKYNYSMIMALAVFMIFSGFSLMRLNGSMKKEEKKEIPAEVNTVLQKSCAGCHSVTSTNDKAKDKLNLTNWNNLSVTAQAGKLDEIRKTVTEGDMPPKKFLERYPDKKLTADEAKILTDWAKAESKRLSK